MGCGASAPASRQKEKNELKRPPPDATANAPASGRYAGTPEGSYEYNKPTTEEDLYPQPSLHSTARPDQTGVPDGNKNTSKSTSASIETPEALEAELEQFTRKKSRAVMATEPSPLADSLSIKFRVFKARIAHGINDDVDQFQEEIRQTSPRMLNKDKRRVEQWVDTVLTSRPFVPFEEHLCVAPSDLQRVFAAHSSKSQSVFDTAESNSKNSNGGAGSPAVGVPSGSLSFLKGESSPHTEPNCPIAFAASSVQLCTASSSKTDDGNLNNNSPLFSGAKASCDEISNAATGNSDHNPCSPMQNSLQMQVPESPAVTPLTPPSRFGELAAEPLAC